MTPDPLRQWFVYFKEQEMGPFAEPDLRAQVISGEIDDTAYVFTEGMSDWTALGDVPVLKKAAEPKREPPPPAAVEAPAPRAEAKPEPQPEPRREPEPVIKQSVKAQQVVKQPVAAQPIEAEKVGASAQTQQIPRAEIEDTGRPLPSKSRKGLKLALFAAILILLGLLAWEYMGANLLMNLPNPLGKQESAETSPEGAAAQDQSEGAVLARIWAELGAMRASEDRNGPPFITASHVLSPGRPVLLGALSKLVQSQTLHLAVYPDPNQHLMAHPRVWMIEVPVIGGYFSAGPFTSDGAELPPGIYKVLVQTKGNYLGQVSFEVAGWPTEPELSARQKDIQNLRVTAAERERGVVEDLFRRLDSSFEELRKISAQAAVQGPARRRQWLPLSKAWIDGFQGLAAEARLGTDYTFYFEARNRMSDFVRNINRLYGMMGLYSQKGQAAFEAAAQKKYTQVWTDISKERDVLRGEIQALQGQAVGSPGLNEELLKQVLLEQP